MELIWTCYGVDPNGTGINLNSRATAGVILLNVNIGVRLILRPLNWVYLRFSHTSLVKYLTSIIRGQKKHCERSYGKYPTYPQFEGEFSKKKH